MLAVRCLVDAWNVTQMYFQIWGLMFALFVEIKDVHTQQTIITNAQTQTMLGKLVVCMVAMTANGWRYGYVCLPTACQFTTNFQRHINYTAC